MIFRLLLAVSVLFTNSVMANTIGSDHQNYNPGHTYEDYLTVHSARTLGSGKFSLGIGANHAVNTLPYYIKSTGNNTGDRFEYNDGLTSIDLGIAVGLLNRLDLFVAAPYIVDQRVKDKDDGHGHFDRLGNTEIRSGLKVNFYDGELLDLALVGIANYNRIRNNPYTGNVNWPTHSLEAIAELSFSRFSLATNIGYRWRHSEGLTAYDGDLPFSSYQDQWLFSTAAEWHWNISGISTIAEIYGNYSEEDLLLIAPRDASVLEGLMGLRFQVNDRFYAQVGGGGELRHAISSADQRYFASIQWKIDGNTRAKEPVVEDKEPAPHRTEKVIIEFEDMQFAFDSSALNYKFEKEKLFRVRELLSDPSKVEMIILEGHTCKIGSDEYNFGLGDRRTDTVMDWLTHTVDFPREKIIPVSYGEKKPIASNETEEGREKNRRVRFEIVIRK